MTPAEQALRGGAVAAPRDAAAAYAPSDADASASTGQRSLFGEILDWMLAPLFLLWPMSVAITYLVAQSIANAPFDRELSNSVNALAQQVKTVNGKSQLVLSPAASNILRADETDNVYFLVLGTRGELLGGDRDLPLPGENEPAEPGSVRFRTDAMRGQDVRIAYIAVEPAVSRAGGTALVQVAETMGKRSQLADEIIKGVIVPQFIILPIAVLLVWFGLSRGIAPLNRLQARIRARRPDDLSLIDEHDAPQEISPLLASFNDLLSRLQQTLQTQKRFVADAAHQMKTPLAGLRTQAELALRDSRSSEVDRSLRQLITSTERATHLINQLLALARTEDASGNSPPMEAIDLCALARSETQAWVGEAMARGIDLGFEEPGHAVAIRGRDLLLRELLKNLVDNALRYSPAGSPVTVKVSADQYGRVAGLEVEDLGPGIPETERGLVFERFYRILGSGSDGSGLGLAIVREIATQHGAEVSVSVNPRATDPAFPGTVIGVLFKRT